MVQESATHDYIYFLYYLCEAYCENNNTELYKDVGLAFGADGGSLGSTLSFRVPIVNRPPRPKRHPHDEGFEKIKPPPRGVPHPLP